MRPDIGLRNEGLDIANRFLYLRTPKRFSLPNWSSLLPIRHIPNSADVAAALGIDNAQDLIVAVDTQNNLFPQDFFLFVRLEQCHHACRDADSLGVSFCWVLQ